MQDTSRHKSTSQPRVSVILPTYNRAEIISKCIDSVLLQNYNNWELIICDDCSTDNTEDICKYYSTKVSKIRYFKNYSRNGLPKNRNVGLKQARGELVFFIEDDLILERECLEVLVITYDNLRANNSVGGIAPRLIEKNGKIYPNKEPFIFNKLTGEITNNYMISLKYTPEVVTLHACSLYPKTLLEVIGGYEENTYIGNFYREETDLNFRIKKMGHKLYYQSNAIAHHNRVRSGGCRTDLFIRNELYTARNHLIFLLRIFGIKAIYMVPFYIMGYPLRALKFIVQTTALTLRDLAPPP